MQEDKWEIVTDYGFGMEVVAQFNSIEEAKLNAIYLNEKHKDYFYMVRKVRK